MLHRLVESRVVGGCHISKGGVSGNFHPHQCSLTAGRDESVGVGVPARDRHLDNQFPLSIVAG